MMTRRDVDLAELGRRQALDDGTAPSETLQQRTAGKRGGRATAKARKALLNAFDKFPFELANAIVHEPHRQAPSPVALVQRLSDRHGPALARSLKRWKIPHGRGTSPLVLVPFLLAGYYLVEMLTHVARPPHRAGRAFKNSAYEGLRALDGGWCSLAFIRSLFPLESDQGAWAENCGAAGNCIAKLEHIPPESLALVRRCENPTCPAPFDGARGPRASRACSGRCRQALRRARVRPPRPSVTIQRSKQKDFGPPPPQSAPQTPLISRRPAR